MDDIIQFSKKEKELETLMQTIRIFSEDIGIEFGIEKCDMQIRNRKRQITKEIELSNQDKTWTPGHKKT